MSAVLATGAPAAVDRRGLRGAARPVSRRRPHRSPRADAAIASLARRPLPGIIADAEALLGRCFPENRVGRVVACGGSNVIPYVYSAHLACLFPQIGAGKKHERPIELEPWQEGIVAM